jgi:5-methylcytosine-specific restriction endonuclease McrA
MNLQEGKTRKRDQSAYNRAYGLRIQADPILRAKKNRRNREEYQRNKAKRRAAMRRYAEQNRDVFQAINRRYYQRNIDRERERQRKKDRAALNAANAKWAKANPDKRAEIQNRRRARKYLVAADRVDYSEVIKMSCGLCGICDSAFTQNDRTHFDHIIPLALGGSHVQSNLQLTHARCNLRKGSRLTRSAKV